MIRWPRSLQAGAAIPALALVAALWTPGQVAARPAPSPYEPEAAIAYSQAAIGREIGAYRFLDRDGGVVELGAYRGKPLVVSLIYTACIQSCPVIVQALARAVEIAQDALGAQSFSVITIGFDAETDTPERMRAYARSQGVDLPRWAFLSSDAATISEVSRDLGFIYYPSPKGFDHLAQVTVLDAEGRVYRQVYGSDFEPPALVEPLKDLVFGRQGNLVSLSGLINRVRLFCTLYDPASERYRFDYSIFIGVTVGSVSLLAMAGLLVRGWLRARRMGPSG